MVEYEPMACPDCGRVIQPDPARVERPRRATSWESCYFRCVCGVGFSNAANPAQRSRITRSPEDNVPEQVRADLSRVLSASVNSRNRTAKRANFCSAHSEDAVTWTVFSFLRQSAQLGVVAQALGLEPPDQEPVISLWGAPLREERRFTDLCDAYLAASTRLDENPCTRSEPDVIVAWRDLIVFVEVKHTSDNEVRPNASHFDGYLDDPAMWSTPVEAVKQAGFYELARNWRLGIELAGSRRFALINLGPERTRPSAQRFECLIRTSAGRRFRHVLWSRFLASVSAQPPWLKAFLAERGVAS